jgi:hypothetical protein
VGDESSDAGELAQKRNTYGEARGNTTSNYLGDASPHGVDRSGKLMARELRQSRSEDPRRLEPRPFRCLTSAPIVRCWFGSNESRLHPAQIVGVPLFVERPDLAPANAPAQRMGGRALLPDYPTATGAGGGETGRKGPLVSPVSGYPLRPQK